MTKKLKTLKDVDISEEDKEKVKEAAKQFIAYLSGSPFECYADGVEGFCNIEY